MANEKEPTPGTRGWRANEIRKAAGLTREQFADELAKVAARLDLDSGGKWTPTRVSQVILSRKPIALDDAAAIVAFAAARGLKNYGWEWFVLGGRNAVKRETRERQVG